MHCVRFVAGSQTIVSVSEDKTIAVWEWEKSDSFIMVLKGHDDWVRSVAVSNAGDRLFWDLATGLQAEEIVQSSAIWTVALSADDMKVAIGLENGALKVLDSWTGETHLKILKRIRERCILLNSVQTGNIWYQAGRTRPFGCGMLRSGRRLVHLLKNILCG